MWIFRTRVPRTTLFLALLVSLSTTSSAQIERNAEERRQRLELVESLDWPLERFLARNFGAVVWVPSALEEVPTDSEYRTFNNPEDPGYALTFARFEVPVGSGVVQVTQDVLDSMFGEGSANELRSVRATEVAGLPAMEIVGYMGEKGVDITILLLIDSGAGACYQFFVHNIPERAETADSLYRAVVEGWTNLDEPWTEGFEEARAELAGSYTGNLWAERNAVFCAVAEPEAIGQAWVRERVRALGEEHPVLLIDGLIHQHPRVRAVALEEFLARVDGKMYMWALEFALRDEDPMVRYAAAMAAAVDAEGARALLARALELDQKAALSGAFQLLALLDEDERAEAVRVLSSGKVSPAGKRMLTSLLGAWGGEEARTTLRDLWRGADDEGIANAAFHSLLQCGDGEALEAAWKRLEDPLGDHALGVGRALGYVLARSPLGDAATIRRLKELHELLATARDDESIHPWQDDWIGGALETLEECEDYLNGLPEGLDFPEEARALAGFLRETPGARWARERLWATAPRDAEFGEQIPLVQLQLTNPGAVLAAVAGIVGRLELASEPENRILGMLLEGARDNLDHELPDPLMSRMDMSRTSGVDMRNPWRWCAWTPATTAGWRADWAGTPLTAGVELPCEDTDQFLRFFVRSSRKGDELTEVVQAGLGAAAMLPLAPGFLWLVWNDMRVDVTGEDEYQGPEHEDRYLALVPEVEGERYQLSTLDVFRGGLPEWGQSFVRFADGVATLTRGVETLRAGPFAPPPGEESSGLFLTFDFATLVEQAGLGEEDWERDWIAAGTKLFANLIFDGETLETKLTLQGLPEAVLPVLSNLGVDGLSAPVDLLPTTAHLFGGVRFDPAALSRWMLAESLRATDDAEEKSDWKQALRFLASLRGEAGVAVLGIPEFERDPEEAWLSRLVVYVSTEPERIRAFLQADDEVERVENEDLELYRDGDRFLALVGGYLVLSEGEEVLRAVGHGPFLAQNDLFQALRVPDDAAGVGFMDTEFVAKGLLGHLPEGEDKSLLRLGISALRATGPVHAWLRTAPNEIEGAVALRPNLLPEASSDQVHRLVGYASHSAGSVRSAAAPVGGDPAEMQFLQATLRLPENQSLPAAWTGRRIDSERMSDGSYEITNRAGASLPESSRASLPIDDPELARFLRSEGVLAVDARSVRELAERIRDGETDPARIVRNVIVWVDDNLEYEKVEDASSLDTLATLEADCSEFTDLTVTLCRALGVPARRVGGLVLGSGMFFGHAWVEVYLDRWYEIDPTWSIAHISGAHLRIPDTDLLLLVNDPEVTLTPTTVEWTGGVQVSWHAVPDGFRGENCTPTVAAYDDSILLGLTVRGPTGENRATVLFSGDGGRTFERTEDVNLESGRSQLLVGHGRLYRIESTASGPVAYALESSGLSWRVTALPDEVLDTIALSQANVFFARDRSGFLALAPDPTRARLFRLDPDLRLTAELELPEGLGRWMIGSAEEPVLALYNRHGTTLFEEEQGGWVAVSKPLGTDRFVSSRILVRDETVEVTGWYRTENRFATILFDCRERTSSLELLPPGDEQTCQAGAAPFLWSVSLRDGQVSLTRESLR